MALEPELRVRIPRPPSTTHVPVGKLLALPMPQFGCQMGRILIGNIDVVLVTVQALPQSHFRVMKSVSPALAIYRGEKQGSERCLQEPV